MNTRSDDLLAALETIPAKHREMLLPLIAAALTEAREAGASGADTDVACGAAFSEGFQAGVTAMEKQWHAAFDAMNTARQFAGSDLYMAGGVATRKHRAGLTDACNTGCLSANAAISEALAKK